MRLMEDSARLINDEGRLALITEASSAIGKAFAHQAAQEGFDLALVARRDESLQTLASEISAQYAVSTMFFRADLCDPDSTTDICNWLTARSRSVDVLVNNSGHDVPEMLFARDLKTLLAHNRSSACRTFALTYHCLHGMIERGWGRIINICPMAAVSSDALGNTPHSAHMSFIKKFSLALNAEVASYGVKVSAVCPYFAGEEFPFTDDTAEENSFTLKFLKQSLREIAKETWRRNGSGAEIIVPGLVPRVTAAFTDVAPEHLLGPMTVISSAGPHISE